MIALKPSQKKKDLPDSTKVTPEIRAKCIEEYLNNKKKCKELICRPWIRGLCIFSENECRYAHGIKALVYKDPSEFPPGYVIPKVIRSFKMKIGENFQGFMDFQNELIKRGEMKPHEIISMVEIEQDKDKRKYMREKLRKHVTLQFLNLFFEKHKKKMITRNFLDTEAERVGLYPVDIASQYGDYYYQVKIKNENHVFKCDKDNLADSLNKKILFIANVLILNGESLPISSELISKNYHKYCLPTEPILYQILKLLGKTLEWILYQLELKSETKEYLGLSKESQETIFISQEKLLKKKLQHITDNVRGFWAEKGEPASKYETLYNYILNKLPDAIEFYGSEAKFARILKKICLLEGCYAVYFASSPYFVKPDLKSPLRYKPIKNKCEYDRNSKIIPSKEHELLNKSNPLKVLQDKDIEITVIDDRQGFEHSVEFLNGVTDISIDLEGLLRQGSIELLQVGVGGDPSSPGTERRIFIFDLLTIQKNESLFKEVKEYLRHMLTDEKISKTFQDCRTDSKAIHKFLQVCPKGIFDIAAAETLISTLGLYLDNLKVIESCNSDNNNEEALHKVLRQCEEIKWPGLNDILLKYKATHGPNQFKSKMKKMFGTHEHRQYFLNRPIEHEYLLYSAQDVQDLVEVKYKMLNMIDTILQKLNVTSKEVQQRIISKIFKSYSSRGCRLVE